MPDLPRVGEEFAGYRLVAKLGRGGMSVVYRAENWRLGNIVALKILPPDLASDDTFRTRFLQESRTAASLNHPHVVPIVDYGAQDGLLYIAMRFVAGTDLRQLIADRGRLEPGTAVHLLSQAALALDAAHRRGLVHRDVKPANLLLERTSDDADPDHLYLADFGISKYAAGPSSGGRTLGTPLYAAPEQIQQQAVDGAADQYSLGCVLYECLTGSAPFGPGLGLDVIRAHVEALPAPPTELRPELPPAIDAVFARVLAKHPEERYPSCGDFMAAARDALQPAWSRPRDAAGLAAFRSAPTPPRGIPRIPPVPPAPDVEPYTSTQSVDLPPMQPLPGAERLPGEEPSLAEGAYAGDGPYQGGEPHQGERHHEDQAGSWNGGQAPAGGRYPGLIDDTLSWSVPPAAPVAGGTGGNGGNGQERPGGPAGPARQRGTGKRLDRRALWSLVALVVAAAAVGGGVLASQSGNSGTVGSQAQTSPAASVPPSAAASSAAASPSLPPSALFSALTKTAGTYPGDLRLSACQQLTTTLVQCTSPSAAIASVSFQTFTSLKTLYLHYTEIVENLTGKPFASSENKNVCGSLAPAPTGESTWNQTEGTFTTYSVAQSESGKLPANVALGRVFCMATKGGSQYIVWTQNSGDLLGYATGATSDQQAWNWFTDVHRDISLPARPAAPGTPAATASAGG